MRFSRAVLTAVAVVALIGSTLGAVAAAAPPAKAADVGITDKEIRLAVVADVENPVVPGLFQSAVDGMRAWAKLVNKHGGIAGRKVAIDFIDSKLSPDEARNATIKACSDDFAMVGGEALFLNNVDDVTECPDANGKPVGMPDLPGLALDPTERCSPVTYIASGDTAYCATKDEHPQTYHSQRGEALYYLEKNKDLHGIFTVPSDLRSTKNSQQAYFEADVASGIKKDGEGFIDTSARSPQSAMTPIVQVIKDHDSNFVYNGNAPNIMVLLRREAKFQNANSVKVWACNQGCYDAEFLKSGGADVDGTYSVLTTLPFYSEYKANPTLKALIKELGGVKNMNSNGMAAWTAALLFQQAAEQAVADGGTLTRQSLLDALKTIHDFDAKGLLGPTDVGNHQPPACIVIVQVVNGKWVRKSPSKVGTFDCNKKNILVHKLDLT